MTFRHLLLFACALTLVSSVAWLAQQQTSSGDPVLSSAGPPSLAAQPAAGSAPSPAAAVAASAPSVDARWVRRTAAAAGIPEVALGAYARAVLGSPASCGLGWTTLAGIGWVESQHGTLGGRSLDASGRPSSPIVGPALDGAGPVAAIRATASGSLLHGDPKWDHAVGPLQFLPSTWETWARDGDGDGTADPQDLDDAGAAAAASAAPARTSPPAPAGRPPSTPTTTAPPMSAASTWQRRRTPSVPPPSDEPGQPAGGKAGNVTVATLTYKVKTN